MGKHVKTPVVLEKHGMRIKEQSGDYVVLSGVLNASMLKKMSRSKTKRTIGGVYNSNGKKDGRGKKHTAFRSSKIAWLLPGRMPWLTQRLSLVAQGVGNEKWPRLLPAPSAWRNEPVQDTEYSKGDHYTAWHYDSSIGSPTEQRDLAIVVMLTSRKCYGGGEFEAKLGSKGARSKSKIIKLDTAGDAVVFPAKRLLHRVRHVTSGRRRTLVSWVSRRSADSDSDSDSDSEVE
jgi:hypothetical protein